MARSGRRIVNTPAVLVDDVDLVVSDWLDSQLQEYGDYLPLAAEALVVICSF